MYQTTQTSSFFAHTSFFFVDFDMSTKRRSNIPSKFNPDGRPNRKYVDMDTPDPEIPGQQYVAVSLVNPEDILKQREHFLFEQFVHQWDFKTSMDKFDLFLAFLCHEYNLPAEEVTEHFKTFVHREMDLFRKYEITMDLQTFLDANEKALNEKFNAEHEFQTSTRGIKIRGTFPTRELCSRYINDELVPRFPNDTIHCGVVGKWMPINLSANAIQDVVYQEEELNELHRKKQENMLLAKRQFDRDVDEKKRLMVEENMRNAEKYGQTPTQYIDESGKVVRKNMLSDLSDRNPAKELENPLGAGKLDIQSKSTSSLVDNNTHPPHHQKSGLNQSFDINDAAKGIAETFVSKNKKGSPEETPVSESQSTTNKSQTRPFKNETEF